MMVDIPGEQEHKDGVERKKEGGARLEDAETGEPYGLGEDKGKEKDAAEQRDCKSLFQPVLAAPNHHSQGGVQEYERAANLDQRNKKTLQHFQLGRKINPEYNHGDIKTFSLKKVCESAVNEKRAGQQACLFQAIHKNTGACQKAECEKRERYLHKNMRDLRFCK